jgi:ferrous-iron efflux pump FieF
MVAKKHNSSALAAEAVHLRGDLWACIGILLGLVATHVFKEARLDPVFAAGMTLFAFGNAIHLMRDVLRPLVDASLPDGEEACIREVLLRDPRVMGFHKLRTRQAGSQKLADVHILLDDELSFRDAHRIGEEIEDALRAALPNLDIMVHAEPFYEEIAHQRERHAREREWDRGELGEWEIRGS